MQLFYVLLSEFGIFGTYRALYYSMKTTPEIVEFNEIQNKYEITQNLILNQKEWKRFLKNAPELSSLDQSCQTQQGTIFFNTVTRTVYAWADSDYTDLTTDDQKLTEAWAWLAVVKDDIKAYIRGCYE